MKHSYLAVILSLLVACSIPEPPVPSHVDLIGALASPVMLEEGETNLYLDDYFVPLPTSLMIYHNGSELVMNPGEHSVAIRQRTDLLNPAEEETPEYLLPISVLHISADGAEHDIPVFKSEKKRFTFTFEPDAQYLDVAIAGSLNGWNPNATPLSFEGGVWQTELYLSEGIWDYQLVVDGEWVLDPTNPMKRSNGQGGHNSMLTVGNPKAFRPYIRAVSAKENTIAFEGTPGAHAFIWWENQLLAQAVLDRQPFIISVPEAGIDLQRSHIRAYVCNDERRGNDLLIPLEHGRAITDAG